ncbi:hypothetical protein LSH36_776g02017, partial [Paralvinella palmiformis]
CTLGLLTVSSPSPGVRPCFTSDLSPTIPSYQKLQIYQERPVEGVPKSGLASVH